jgi:septal ring factor EnvC (AmiA/AmiB activator)
MRVLLCILLLILGGASSLVRADAPPIEQRQSELERIKKKLGSLSESLGRRRSERESLQRKLDETEKALVAARRELAALDDRIAAQMQQTEAARERRDAAAAQLDAQRGELARQVRATYLTGLSARTRLLFSQGDPTEISRLTTYFDYYNRYRSERIAAVRREMDALSAAETELQEQLRMLAQLRSEQLHAVDTVARQKRERGAAMLALKSSIDEDEDEVARLQAQEKRVQKLLARLREEAARPPPPPPRPVAATPAAAPAAAAASRATTARPSGPFPSQKGRLLWPLQGPLLARYGEPKAGGRLNWTGLWISAPEGTPVRAVADGRVAYVGWLQRYGLIVIVQHDGGYYSLYGHNRSVRPAVGDPIRAGDVLGEAGDTGGYDRSGLYFEMRSGTDPIDPGPWLAR